MTRLACCRPTAYAGGGASVVVHGPLCDRAEQRLTPEELALWRQTDLDPVKESVKAHPVRKTPAWVTWMSHPRQCTCEDCEYVNAHIDDGTYDR